MNYKTIEKKIDDISIVSSREERKQLAILKKMISSFNDTLNYEAYYDKRLQVANYNKLIVDTLNLDIKGTYYFLFIKMPSATIDFYDDSINEKNQRFFMAVKNVLALYPLSKQNIYNLGDDYFVLICDKKNVKDIYDKIKNVKKSRGSWRKFQMTFVKYERTSNKPSKNVANTVKRALEVFKGDNLEAIDDNEAE